MDEDSFFLIKTIFFLLFLFFICYFAADNTIINIKICNMKSKNLQKMTAIAVLIFLLHGAVGMTKGYAYNVTIGAISNGTVVANPTTANEGDTVTLMATF